jgi:hypothetical protein
VPTEETTTWRPEKRQVKKNEIEYIQMNGQQSRPVTDVITGGYLALHVPRVYTNKGECKKAGYGHILGYTGIIITSPTGQLSRTTQTICRTGEMERENKSYSREEEEEEEANSLRNV